EHAKQLSVWHSAKLTPGGEGGPRVEERRRREPRRRVAAATRGRIKAMLDALLAFRKAHRRAWEAMNSGFHNVVFPAGTWFA
ncbi:MAG TPA: hypothetical protein PK095_15645, partial [Myxococcota bacterium]|nr:hypothetical protein [Myxococcota bacterium]